MSQASLFDLPTDQLLARFGAGNATPGSGCAAALMSMLAANVVIAVAKMTVEKSREDQHIRESQNTINLLQNKILPRLKQLFDEDAQVFEEVIKARKKRDAGTPSERRRYGKEATDQLRRATDILFEISDLSFSVLDRGLGIWRVGFRPAMGDAGAGISASTAAITTCLLVANVNLRSSKAQWALGAKAKCDSIFADLQKAQTRISVLIGTSNDQTKKALTLALSIGSDVNEAISRGHEITGEAESSDSLR